MTEPDLSPVQDLFARALDLSPEAREGLLKGAGATDPRLEAEVRSLLGAHEVAGGFLEKGQVTRALAEIPPAETSYTDPLIGAVIGDYRILELLARGGMGAVYRAEQEHPRREVALKLIDRGIITPELLRRFEVEAQLLARLKHPGIAQIHVAGATGPEHGRRPFFAMELVDGLPLTAFAEERKLSRRERLEVVIKICEAVQHAHQLGVIHRDLKPANILVTAEGRPKILDFGVARSTDRDLQVTTVAEGGASLIGTLPYMSPEQVRGNPDELDTRSDVHALGILAYELLCGRLPRDLEGKSPTEAIRLILDSEPRSLAAASAERFPPDLVTIVGKALESDRDRRYDSASGLAADLRRFLDGQPISARPPSAIYQLQKLVVRNRIPALLLGGLVLLAIASAVITGILAQRASGERDRANVEAVTANAAANFLESLFLEADPEEAIGETLTAREILDRGAGRIAGELQDQPAVQGRLLAMLGKVYDSLGHEERATELLEEAVAIGRERVAQRGEPTNESNLELALQYLARGRIREKRFDEAVALGREAVALSETVYGVESANYATSLNHLAYHLSCVGAHDEAQEMNLRGLALREKLLGPDHVDVGWSVFQYAWLLRTRGEREAAREQFERASTIWETALPENHPQFARCLADYAQLLVDLQEPDLARDYAEHALSIRREALAGSAAMAAALHDIGNVYWRLGDFAPARDYFVEAARVHEATLGETDAGLLTRLHTVVFIHDEMNDVAEQEATLRRVLELVRAHHLDSPRDRANVYGKLGLLFTEQHRVDEAIGFLEQAREALGEIGESRDPDLSAILQALTYLLRYEGDFETLLDRHRQHLALREEHPEWSEPNPLFLRYRIGLDLLLLDRLEESEACLRELLPEATEAFDTNAFFASNVRWLLAHCRYGLGFEEEARGLYDEILASGTEPPREDIRWRRLRQAEGEAAHGRFEFARQEIRAALRAGLDPLEGRHALLANPHLGVDARDLLLAELEGR